MLVDSWYDAYLGVVVLIRVIDGVIKKGDRIRMMSTNGHLPGRPPRRDAPGDGANGELGPGEIGFMTASIKQVRDTRVGDTITHEKKQCAETLPGFKPSQPVVFCGLFPVDCAEFEDLRDAIETGPERRQLLPRNGNLSRAWLWLPLRLPRPPAPRSDPRPAGA